MDKAMILRRVLWLDAATCVGCGLLLSLGAGALAGPLGLPAGLLMGAGLALFPVAGLLGWIAGRAVMPRGWLWVVILGNVGWAVGSFALLLLPGLAPTGLGVAFVAGQGVAVLGLAGLEWRWAG